jgi:carbamoyl-phosphate synthase small subunit
MFGLCLGHQIIALAAGARTYKLPFGHHGGNHPVQDKASGRIDITAQNHNYAVDAASLEGLPLEVPVSISMTAPWRACATWNCPS